MAPRPRRAFIAFALGLWIVLTPGLTGAQLPDTCEGLGAALVDHSCFHTTFGPFTTVLATAGREPTGATADVDSVHTEYRVGLTGNESVVTYRPERSGAWSVFLGTSEPLTLLDSNHQSVPELLRIDGGTGCETLPHARVFTLEAGQRYTLVFGPTSATSVVVVIEHIDDFLAEAGIDLDGDGYGDAKQSVITPCLPPEGYAPNASDCDDQDPEVNPGATELCDGVDQNCNGAVDDIGLTCRVGVGACQQIGELDCPVAGQAATCSVTPAPVTEETCNGIDDNCDGDIDDGDDLCPSLHEPTCVRLKDGAFCGCLLDIDCGPRDSGRICVVEDRRCEDGCSQAAGRNGCPNGYRCDEASNPPRCVVEEDDSTVGNATSAGTGGTGNSDEPSDEDTTSDAGCGCRVAGSRAPGGGAAAACLLLLLWVRRQVRRRGSRSGSGLRLAAVALALVGCGGKSTTSEADAIGSNAGSETTGAAEDCVPILGETAVGHACSHTTNGPFDLVVAYGSTEPIEPPDVSAVHRTFDVEVAEAGALLEYRPRRDGEHVLLVDATPRLEVLDAADVRVPSSDFPVAGCSTIQHGFRASLTQGLTYTLRVVSGSPARFRLFVEHVGTFGGQAWRRSCD